MKIMTCCSGLFWRLSIWSYFILLHSLSQGEKLPKIGIIGAGVGGTSSAYFLRQLFGDEVHIDIFEANQVGGRTALVDVAGHKFESGAVIIHGKNRYMIQFNELFRNDKSYINRGATYIGVHGKEGMVFQGSPWTAVAWMKALWKYGWDLFTIQKYIKNSVFPLFERIYTFQEKGMAFTTCENMLGAMSEDFVEMTKKSIEDVMVDLGLSQAFIQELGAAITRNNYGQTLQNVHGFVGTVSLGGMDSDLWSVNGGNVNMPITLLKESKASLIKGRVTSVALVQGDPTKYKVSYVTQDEDAKSVTGSDEYDIVIVATPINGTRTKFTFDNFPRQVTDFSQDYHTTVAMILQGKLNKKTFPIEEDDDFPQFLFTADKDSSFDFLEKQDPAEPIRSTSGLSTWQVFFNHTPTQQEIDNLFESKNDVNVIDWLAYPEYRPKMDLPSFVLNERLYYINGIESVASALEMVAIGAKNTALLAFNQWYGFFDRIDENEIPHGSGSSNAQSEL